MVSPAPVVPRYYRILEVLYLVVVTALAFHVINERIEHRFLPSGDEGSWMAAAAELSQGNGFSTRWLEYGFLQHYTLPRPDDFRYPALVSLLAAGFAVFGKSYTTGLWVVGATFILFGLAVYGVIRRRHGRRTAAATLPLVFFSLLQLRYNTLVYTEALFGIGLALLVYISVRWRPSQTVWWLWSGATIGFLYLVRPNAILFSVCFAVFGAGALALRKRSWKPVVAGLGIMVLVMLPWLLRSWLVFGNPFHLAGSAGLLRATEADPCTYTVSDFSRLYGIFYFAKATLAGIPHYFKILHEQEHGLEVIPLIFCVVGIVRRKRFAGGMVTAGFLLSFFACAYASTKGSWAGNRYFMPFLPFVYAYGVHEIFAVTDRLVAGMRRSPKGMAGAALAALTSTVLLAPVFYPHRYYERLYKTTPVSSRDYSAYYATLREKLDGHPFYYAGSLAQINFATSFNCIGMQFRFDEKELRQAQTTFKPRLMALRPTEYREPFFSRLIDTLKTDGYGVSVSTIDTFAVIIEIKERTHNN